MARDYTPQEVGIALAAYAMAAGSAKQTEAILAEANMPIPIDTLRGWAYRHHKDRYEQIKKEVEDHVRSQLADQFTELASAATLIQRNALEELLQRVSGDELITMSTKDLLDVLAKSGVAGGIALDKADKLMGRPAAIIRHDFSELRRILSERHGVNLVVKGEVVDEVDVTDAEEVADDHQLEKATPA